MSDLRGGKILNFKKVQKNTLQGVFDLALPFGGIVLRGCCFQKRMASGGSDGQPSLTRNKMAQSIVQILQISLTMNPSICCKMKCCR